MGLTKKEIFTEQQNYFAVMLKAIGHPARVAILQKIIESNTCFCGNLAHDLGLAQPTVSQHLKELKNAGLIQGRIEGVSVCYCINASVWNGLKIHLVKFFETYDLMPNCCKN